MHSRIAASLWVTLCLLFGVRHALADEPAVRPAIPALITGAAESKSFAVDGYCHFTEAGSLGFRVAADEKRELCVIYDPSDETPLILSDGEQTLVYDLAQSRIVRIPRSRAYIRIDWHEGKKTPLAFAFGVDFKSAIEDLKDSDPWFRIDQFVKAAGPTLKLLDSPAGKQLFAAEREGGSVESLETRTDDASQFRFFSLGKDETFYRLALDAKHINQPIPDAVITFPDLDQLGKEIEITDFEGRPFAAILAFVANGRGWLAKAALATASDSDFLEMLPGADRDKLKKRDAELGAKYREALARNGFKINFRKGNAPVTAPSR